MLTTSILFKFRFKRLLKVHFMNQYTVSATSYHYDQRLLFVTTATMKVEINLVVTMILPWLMLMHKIMIMINKLLSKPFIR